MTPHRKNVLREILDPFCLDTADILGREDINNLLAQYEEIERVPNRSFDRAQAILEKTHFSIIAGIPGIGKTALAEVLLADLVDRQGFTAYRVALDLAELRPVKNAKSKQFCYFDDFLGKTALEKLQKNEDQRLVELMEEVSANPRWRSSSPRENTFLTS